MKEHSGIRDRKAACEVQNNICRAVHQVSPTALLEPRRTLPVLLVIGGSAGEIIERLFRLQ